jgi:hypothetical protein
LAARGNSVPVSAVDCVQPAIQHTRDQLFRPFRFGQWSRLALVGILAAEVHSSGCNIPHSNLHWPTTTRGHQFASAPFPGLDKFDPARIAQFAGLIIAVVVLAFIIGLIFAYISSVFRFILFDSVLTRRCSIGEGWNRWHRAGRRYFLWRIVLFIAQLLLFGVVIAVPLAIAAGLGWFRDYNQHIARTVIGILMLIGLFLFSLLVAVIVQQISKDFLVPIMALEDVDFADGWSRLVALIRPEPGRFAVYLLMKLVLAIAAEIVFGIAALIPATIIVAPAAIVVIAAYSAGITWTAATISLAIILGALLLVILIYVIALVCVPSTVFFPAFAIHFFAARYPRLDAILHPAPPVAPIPAGELPPAPEPPQSFEPPPLPPTPEPIG